MKRIVLAILTVAVCAGIFLPVTLSLSADRTVAVSTQTAFAQNTPAGAAPSVKNEYDITSNFKCGVGASGDNSSLAGCLEWVLYFIPFKVGGWLMMFSAMAFDSLASLTLSSSLYSSSSFIADGWRVTRDFGNIFFILVLLLAALSLVLDIEIGHANPKKMIASVIFIALIVNFSFFITEAVIDTSNALALVFYNQITITNKNGPITPNAANIPTGVVPPKDISAALVTAFQPQQLNDEDFWKNLEKPTRSNNTHVMAGCITGAIAGTVVPVIGNAIGCTVGGILGYFITTTGSENQVPDSVLISILILAGAMFCVVAYSFFIAAISFLGRLIGLWIAIIFAPFAFVSYIMPSAQHIEGFGWSDWWKSLFTLAFSGPIYFFFLYLIALMTRSSFAASTLMATASDRATFATLAIMFLSFMFFIVMLLKATTYVKKASGEIGSMVFKGAAMLGGTALGAISGMGAGLLSRTLGAYAKSRDTEEARDLAAGRVNSKTREVLLSKYKPGSAEYKNLEKLDYAELAESAEFQSLQRESARKLARWQKSASSSYDFRQSGIGNAFSSATGMNMESFGSLSTANTAGGYNGAVARKAAKLRAFTDSLEADHGQITELENTIAARDKNAEAINAELRVANSIANGIADKKSAAWKKARADVLRLEKKLKDNNMGDDSEGTWQPGDEGDPSTGKPPKLKSNGKPVTKNDIGTSKNTWTSNDVGKRKKANGDPVSEMDVRSAAIRTESQSLTDLKKALERAKTDRAKSFMHQQMVQSPYMVHGQTYDNYGQLSQMGHLDFNNVQGKQNADALRSWRNDVKGAFGGNFVRNIKNNVVKGIGEGIADAISGGMTERLRDVFINATKILPVTQKQEPMFSARFTEARMEGRAINVAADLSHQIHTFHTKYKSPGKGILDFLKSLSGGDGGGHGGGHDAHGGGHGGGHAGDHH
ncbi:MAG: hypothetical protein WCG55_02420 [bacterium]